VKKAVVKKTESKVKPIEQPKAEEAEIDDVKLFNAFHQGIFKLYDETYKGTRLHSNCAPLYAASVNMFGLVYNTIEKHRRKKLLDSFSADIKNTYGAST